MYNAHGFKMIEEGCLLRKIPRILQDWGLQIFQIVRAVSDLNLIKNLWAGVATHKLALIS